VLFIIVSELASLYENAPLPELSKAILCPHPAMQLSPKSKIISPTWSTTESNEYQPAYNQQPQEEGSGINSSGNVGDTDVTTGDATNDSSISTNGNNNYSAGSDCCSGGSTTTISNDGNGAGSTNTGASTTTINNNTDQGNSAVVANTLDQSTDTGDNNTSYNVGDSTIVTGDANTTGTVITSVNTNVDGIAVSEFNVVDDHVGDIILDFGESCIAGCGQSIALDNSGNGAFSYNDASSDTIINNTTDQANVDNSLNLAANTGLNDANFNTGGDSNIITGDANVAASVLTFANNNFAGNVIYAVVNIFGDLIGDIILTEEMMNTLCGGTCDSSTTVANSGNGADSTNIADANNITNNDVFQSNDATITNTLILDAETGSNDTNFNTNGDSSIITGDASIDVNLLNIANLNLIGGNLWLVIVNEAGNWVGKIFGSDGTNFAGSPLIEFIVDPLTGGITATNSDNGAGSVNQVAANSDSNNTINQTNNAVINNELNLSANTGGNTANYNTGGDSNIITGDANIIANIVNFVNNNIVGDGTLLVTVVNVFGSWVGDFLTPGAIKDDTQVVAQGGLQTISNVSKLSTNSEGGSNEERLSNDSNNSTPGLSLPATTHGNVVIAAGSSTVSPTITIQNNDSGILVAGINNDQLIAGLASTEEKTLNINLAWGILLLPIFGMIIAGYLVKKRYLKVKINNTV